MTAKDYLDYIVTQIHSTVVATVNTPYGHTQLMQPYSITKQGSESF